LEKIRFAVIGGTGLEGLFKDSRQRILKTPYGTVTSLFPAKASGETGFFS